MHAASAPGPGHGSGAPNHLPGEQALSVLQRAAQLLAAQQLRPDAHALARMLAAAAAAPGRSEPDEGGRGPGRRGSPSGDQREGGEGAGPASR